MDRMRRARRVSQVGLVFLLVGCADPGKLDKATMDVSTLSAVVMTLQEKLDAAEAEIAKLKAGGAGKQPHLVVASTGVSLGVSLGGSCAWNSAAGGEACFYRSSLFEVGFKSSDCTGQPYINSFGLHQSHRVIGFTTWLKPTGTVQNISVNSLISASGVCETSPRNFNYAYAAADTGVPAKPYPGDQLAIELR